MQRTAMGYGLETERLVHSAGGRPNTHILEVAAVPAVKAQIKKDYLEGPYRWPGPWDTYACCYSPISRVRSGNHGVVLVQVGSWLGIKYKYKLEKYDMPVVGWCCSTTFAR